MVVTTIGGLRPIGWAANILRLPTNRNELGSLLAFLALSLAYRLGRKQPSSESMVLLRGARHVFGFGSAEMFTCGEIYVERIYERVADFVPRAGWTVLDVGANVGIFALLQARRGARVYAFEPNPHVFRRLTLASKLNRLEHRIAAFNVGLGERPGTAVLRTPGGVTAWAALLPDRAPSSPDDVSVEIEALDRLFPSLALGHVDLLKVDVEGFELDVLRGGRETLRRVQRVVLEYHSAVLRQAAGDLLAEDGFEIVLDTLPNPEGAGVLYARR